MKLFEIETFRDPTFTVTNLKDEGPSCFNGIVSIRKYRVTVELQDEPKAILMDRLIKLWRKSDNHHHVSPLQKAAKELGFELNHKQLGVDCKR